MSNLLQLIRSSLPSSDPRRESEDGSSYRCHYCDEMVHTECDLDDEIADACVDLECCPKCIATAALNMKDEARKARDYRALSIAAKSDALALARLVGILDAQSDDLVLRLTLSNAQVLAQQLMRRLAELERAK